MYINYNMNQLILLMDLLIRIPESHLCRMIHQLLGANQKSNMQV
ncbi:hypothetical protein VL806_14695 [Listeria seeligeri]|nr:hypothetical protein [Listeria seeligeri]